MKFSGLFAAAFAFSSVSALAVPVVSAADTADIADQCLDCTISTVKTGVADLQTLVVGKLGSISMKKVYPTTVVSTSLAN